MKIILILLLTVNLNSTFKGTEYLYWERMSPSEKTEFLSSHELNKLALSYYKEEIKVSDDEKTFELLKVLTSSSSELIPLYSYLFNKICFASDGALSEVLGGYCLDMILNHTDYIINYFTFERENITKDRYCFQLYGLYLGYEMYFKEEGVSDINYSFKEFKTYLNNHFAGSSTQNKQTLDLFYKCIAEEIKYMSE